MELVTKPALRGSRTEPTAGATGRTSRGEWDIEVDLRVVAGDVVVRGVRIAPLAGQLPVRGMNYEVLRVPLEQFRAVLLGEGRWQTAAKTTSDPEAMTDDEVLNVHREALGLPPLGADPRPNRRRDPAHSGDELSELAALAAQYVIAYTEDPLHCNQLLASRRGETPASVTKRIHRARERDLLTGGGRGRAGGHLTERAQQILRGSGDDCSE